MTPSSPVMTPSSRVMTPSSRVMKISSAVMTADMTCRSSRGSTIAIRRDFAIAEAAGQVIVDHADRLHVRIDDRRADEAEPSALQIPAERVRFRRGGRDLPHHLPAIPLRTPADELPAIGG